jgi:hypothetical protein
MLFSSPSHGENRGSSPLGSANNFNNLVTSRPALPIFGEFLGNKRYRTTAINADYERRVSHCAAT